MQSSSMLSIRDEYDRRALKLRVNLPVVDGPSPYNSVKVSGVKIKGNRWHETYMTAPKTPE